MDVCNDIGSYAINGTRKTRYHGCVRDCRITTTQHHIEEMINLL